MNWSGTIFFLALGSFLAWAPVFAIAYFRRGFGGTKQGYAIAWLATATVTTLIFIFAAVLENSGG